MRISARRTSFTLAFAILAVVVPESSSAQRAPSRADAERTVRELVRVMNLGNQDTLRRFVESRFVVTGPGAIPVGDRVERLSFVAADLGKMRIHKVDTANDVAALVQSERTEQWRHVALWFDSTPPHRILRVGFRPAPAVDAPTRRLSDAEIVDQLRAYVERLAKRDAFSGTVLLAKRGQPLYSAAFGEANKDFGVKNNIDTKFNLGSMNKMFTAVATMQLVEAGKVSLEDTLGKFLKAGAMRPEVLSKVRVKHLLTHTSGLGSYFSDE